MSSLVAYIDGSPRGHIGASGIGVLLKSPGGEQVELTGCVTSSDSNYAEYAALQTALQYAKANQYSQLQVFTDSEVVVRQITGRYACRSRVLQGIYESCKGLIAAFEHFAISHIRREENGEANRLANLAARQGKTREPRENSNFGAGS